MNNCSKTSMVPSKKTKTCMVATIFGIVVVSIIVQIMNNFIEKYLFPEIPTKKKKVKTTKKK